MPCTTVQVTYLGWTERKPSIKNCKANIHITAQLFLEEFGDILHHAFQSSSLFEFRSSRILVLGVNKFYNYTLIFSPESFGICLEPDYNVVGVTRIWRETRRGVCYVTFAISLGFEEWIKLVVFNINNKTLFRVSLVSIRVCRL